MGQRNSILNPKFDSDDDDDDDSDFVGQSQDNNNNLTDAPPPHLTLQQRYYMQIEQVDERDDGRFEQIFSDWASDIRAEFKEAAAFEGECALFLSTLLLVDVPDAVKSKIVRLYATEQDWGASRCINLLSMRYSMNQTSNLLESFELDRVFRSQLLVLQVMSETPDTMLRVRQVYDVKLLVEYLLVRNQPQLLLQLFPAFEIPVCFEEATFSRLMAAKSPDEDALLIAFLDQAPTSTRLEKMLCRSIAPDIDSYDSLGCGNEGEEEKDETDHDAASRRRTWLFHVYCKRPFLWPSMQRVIERLQLDGHFIGRGSDDLVNVLHLAAVRDDADTLKWLADLGVFGLETWERLLATGRFRDSARQKIQHIIHAIAQHH